MSSSITSNFNCDSYHCNKSKKLSFFHMSSLTSHSLLDLVYYDVWGPSPISTINVFTYYVIFVDHFTKYTRLCPLYIKYDRIPIFLKFKATVECHFDTKLMTLYFDLGREYHKLTNSLQTNGVQHLTTLPYRPQRNGPSE